MANTRMRGNSIAVDPRSGGNSFERLYSLSPGPARERRILSEVVRPHHHARHVRSRGAASRRLRALLLTTALLETAAAFGKCSLALLPEMPVTMQGLVPTVHAQINYTDALFIADSGAFSNMVTPAAAADFKMRMDWSVRGLYVKGIGGTERAQLAWAKSFTIMGTTVPDVPFVVAGSNLAGVAGLLGQNVFRIADVEYDLANGVIRLVRPTDCKHASLAYWATAAGKPYSVIDIQFATAQEPHTKAVAYVNGTKIRVMFDTGAGQSLLTLAAAKHAGITPASEGVNPGGPLGGIGHRVANTWIARFASFRLGDEEIQHARLRFGDAEVEADMLIGADFFLSHRVYVASSQHKLYFTYNGGPVFDLEGAPRAAKATDADATPAAPAPGEPAEPQAAPQADARLDQPTDAAGYARRGAASEARHDYENAIADFTRACELAPTESRYFYGRGMARWHNRQADLALGDFDQAIQLKADDPDALLARASLRAVRHDSPDAVAADLAAADRAAPKESDARLRIGSLYEQLDNPAAARLEYSKWIDVHPRDHPGMARALNARCWSGALSGQALEQALADCNAALKMQPGTASFLDSRGLVYLRQGNYDKAITDYDAALHLNPKIAWSLYGRGLAKLRKGQSAAGQADLAAASALARHIAERAAKFGLSP
jgi:tetratricopeptide (TPR) repeat protein